MLYETKFLISFIFTLIIEVPIILIFIRFAFKSKISLLKVIFVGILASALTLPYLWFVLPPYINVSYYFYLGEVLVIFLETIIYNKLLELKFGKALLISTIANAISFVLGFLILTKIVL